MLSILSQLSLMILWRVCMCAQSCSTLLRPHGRQAHEAPLYMGFSRHEYWSRLPFSTPGDLPEPEMKPLSPVLPALAGGSLIAEAPGKPNYFLFFLNLLILAALGLSCSSRDLCCSTWDLVPQPGTMVSQTWYPAAISLKMNHVSLSLQGKQLFVDK